MNEIRSLFDDLRNNNKMPWFVDLTKCYFSAKRRHKLKINGLPHPVREVLILTNFNLKSHSISKWCDITNIVHETETHHKNKIQNETEGYKRNGRRCGDEMPVNGYQIILHWWIFTGWLMRCCFKKCEGVESYRKDGGCCCCCKRLMSTNQASTT